MFKSILISFVIFISGLVFAQRDESVNGMEDSDLLFTCTEVQVDNADAEFLDTSLLVAPSQPQNLSISGAYGVDHPTLSWDANPEQNITGYNVYFRYANTSWLLIASVSQTQYTDLATNLIKPADLIYYCVAAVNDLNQESIKSSAKVIQGISRY